MSQPASTKAQTPVFRVSFPNVFKPRRNDLNGKDEYSVMALFKKGENLDKLKAAVKAAAIAKWGTDQTKWPKNLRSPFRDQGEKAKDVDGKSVLPAGMEEGAIFISLRSQQKPGVVDQQVQPILSESEFYPGCYAVASVNAYAYDQKGNKGIALGLNNIQKVRDGEPLSGKSSPEEDFAPVAGADGGGDSADSMFS